MKQSRSEKPLSAALSNAEVRAIAEQLRDESRPALRQVLELGRALADACGANETAQRLAAEIEGYDPVDQSALPAERRVDAFASPFPVRALDLGLLDPEEVFLVNREKFSQVTLTIAQPIHELEAAVAQTGESGVLSMQVPAAEVSGRSVETDASDHVYIYVLPREIRKILDAARDEALRSLIDRLVEAVAPNGAPPASPPR